MDKLNAAWSKLHSDGLGRKHKLEDALLQLGQFHDALGELLTWIAGCTGRLAQAGEPGVDPGAVEGTDTGPSGKEGWVKNWSL